MASCITEEWVSYSPNAKLTVTQSSSTDTTVTLAWTLQYITDTSDPAYTNGIGRAWSVTIDGTVVKSGTYNINLVSGTNTVASGTTIVDKTKSARNVSFSLSFEFDITWSGVYAGTKTASGSISIAAKTSYTISYNANGGSGAPSSQTKWHGESLTLSSTKPTKTGYTFTGWALSKSEADSGTWYYSAGGSCGKNENLTLYATWTENKLTINYYSNYATSYGGTADALNSVGSDKNVIVLVGEVYYDNDYSTYGLANYSNSTGSVYMTRTGYTATGNWGTTTSGGTLINENTGYATGQALAKALGKDLSSGNASVNLYAQWEINTYTISYNANGGYNTMSSQSVNWQGTFILLDNEFKRDGYKFIGWNAFRNSDSKWYVVGQGWVTEDEINTNGYEKKLYSNQEELVFDMSWIRNNEETRQFTMYAVWEISGVVYIDNGTEFVPYLTYIDNGEDWELYLVYVDNGTEWKIMS